MSESAFDAMVHLIGGQGLPAVLAIKSIPAKRHVLVATSDSMGLAERLKTLYAKDGMAFDIVQVKPFDFAQLRETFSALLGKYRGQRIAADITGGTKPMSLMLAETWKSETLFYVETDVRQAIIDLSRPETIAFAREMKSVHEFVRIHSSAPFQPGQTTIAQEEGTLAKALLPLRKTLGKLYAPLVQALSNKEHNLMEVERKIAAALQDLGKEPKSAPCVSSIRAMQKRVGAERTCKFLVGGWLEAYTFDCLKGMPEVYNLQLNAEVIFKEQKAALGQPQADREFDVSFTDGIHLYVVECKSGRVEQEHVSKVSENARNFGGTYGRGVLVCTKSKLGRGSMQSYENLLKRVRDAKNVMLIELPWKNAAETLRQAIQNWKPGKWEAKA